MMYRVTIYNTSWNDIGIQERGRRPYPGNPVVAPAGYAPAMEGNIRPGYRLAMSKLVFGLLSKLGNGDPENEG